MKLLKWILISLVIAAVVAGGALYLARRGSQRHSGEALSLLAVAPPDAPYVFYADLNAWRRSQLISRLQKMLPPPQLDPDYVRFTEATGFDYTRDLDGVLLEIFPAHPVPQSVAIAEGRFDRDKITRYALRRGKLERQDGFDVYVVPSETPGRTISLAFLGANRIALADTASLGRMLAGRSGSADPEMRERVARVAGAAFFAVGRIGPLPENVAIGGLRSDQFANLARSLRWVTAAARPEGEDLRMALDGECDSPESARQLAGTLDGLRLLGRTALVDPNFRSQFTPEAASLLDILLPRVDVTRDDRRVRLLLEVTPQMLADAAASARPSAGTTAH